MSGAERNPNKPVKRFRFTLLTLFWWQLLLVPLFLAPFYSRNDHNDNAWTRFAAVFLPPICYSALFVWWSSNDLARKQRPVLAAVCHGALYGTLFGLLAWNIQLLRDFPSAFIMLATYGLMGAATGGLMGLRRDCCRPRVATLNPEP